MSIIRTEHVILDLPATDRATATRTLAETLVSTGRVSDLEQFITDVEAREAQMATGLPGGIGIPHCRSNTVSEPSLAFGRCAEGIDWGAEDGPAHLIFLIAAPDGGDDAHMAILAKLARKLMNNEFKNNLREASSTEQVVEVITAAVTA
ncbi:EIIABC-Fru [Dermatophilus congolensis]|uniref:EIIABC-Fru n=1 Tax=Dermatophilus congolensis TaxID=1863 RepID=A0AA46H074_9MICO|nr:fructose PTS transporter subunit IIA [Dermatophilus congolensis]STD08162.1 EIIABC-Fru [Dermatophilus congolensis]